VRHVKVLVDELYNRKSRLVVRSNHSNVPLDALFLGLELAAAARAADAAARLEDLQFEAAPEGARLRRDVGAAGGVAPLAVATHAVADRPKHALHR